MLALATDASAKKPPRVVVERAAKADKTDDKPVDTSNAPFRAKLISNAVIVRRAASTFATVAKQPSPPKLSPDQKRIYAEHSKWLSDGATRLNALHTQMDAVLTKGSHAPATELAQMNMQFLTLCEAIESESRRFADQSAARTRHTAAMSTLKR